MLLTETKEDVMHSAQAEVRALLDSRIEACRAKDIDRLMSLYSPGIVYFDVVPPLHFTGW
jgi:ketosteroid isomerase-like protein